MYSIFLSFCILVSFLAMLAGVVVCGSGLSPVGGVIIIYGASSMFVTFIRMSYAIIKHGSEQ